MATVSDAVARVIDQWVELEEDYKPADRLRSLWALKHPVSPAYEPHGIVRLLNAIKADVLLQNCQDAQELEAGHFVTGGFVQTVQNLHDWLNPCGASALANIEAQPDGGA
jgi:hypothetical protein